MTDIRLPKGIKVGHAQVKGKTGATVILAPDGAVGGVCVQGAAPGTRETDLLHAHKAVEAIHAVVLSGGSAFGLAACDGVMRYLSEQGAGYVVGAVRVPLVAGAVIFDLNDNTYTAPDSDCGYNACKNARNEGVLWGRVGAGTGATVGKILGASGMQTAGIAAATVEVGDVFVTAITVVNALGDVIDYKSGKIVAGAQANGAFVGTQNLMLSDAALRAEMGGNTTLSCVVTNAKISKLQANKLASVCHDGFAKSISPVHTDYDGDTVFVLSQGHKAADFTQLSVMAVEAVCQSIVAAATCKK